MIEIGSFLRFEDDINAVSRPDPEIQTCEETFGTFAFDGAIPGEDFSSAKPFDFALEDGLESGRTGDKETHNEALEMNGCKSMEKGGESKRKGREPPD